MEKFFVIIFAVFFTCLSVYSIGIKNTDEDSKPEYLLAMLIITGCSFFIGIVLAVVLFNLFL